MNKDTDGGLQPGRDPDDIDAAQAALNRMRDAAAARGEIRRAVPRSGAASQKPARAARGTRGFSQFHGTGRDPLGLGKVVGRLVAERGWSSPVAVGSVMARVIMAKTKCAGRESKASTFIVLDAESEKPTCQTWLTAGRPR